MTWRGRGIVGLAALLALCGAFGVGRYSRPAPAVQDQRTAATTSKATSTTATNVEAAKHEVATADTATTVRTVTRWLPAVAAVGACPAIPAHVEQEVVRETHAASTRTADTHRDAQVQQNREQTAQSTVVELHTVTPAPRPEWSATAMVGAQLGGRPLLVPAPYVVGIALERRIIGPISIGIWGTTGMAGGGLVRVDW